MPDNKKRGRKRLGASVMRPDGITPEIQEILKGLAEEAGCSIADLKREMIADALRKAGFTDEEMGLIDVSKYEGD